MRIIFLFLLAYFITIAPSFGQINPKSLSGIWKAYTSPSDTLTEEEGGIWMVFNDTTMITLLSFGGGDLPAPFGNEDKYKIVEDSLQIFGKESTYSVKLNLYHSNFISYSYPSDGKETFVYLKKEDDLKVKLNDK